MKDILGRELQDGDICVGKGTGRNVIGMSIGVWYGNSMTDEDGCKRHMRDVFKVVNPSSDELEIADKIKNKLREQEEKERKKNIKTIPLKDLVIGGIYKGIYGEYYLYLGNRIVSNEYSDGLLEEKGNCFISISKDNTELRREFNASDIEVLKGCKKLVEHIKTVELKKFPIVIESCSPLDYKRKLTIRWKNCFMEVKIWEIKIEYQNLLKN